MFFLHFMNLQSNTVPPLTSMYHLILPITSPCSLIISSLLVHKEETLQCWTTFLPHTPFPAAVRSARCHKKDEETRKALKANITNSIGRNICPRCLEVSSYQFPLSTSLYIVPLKLFYTTKYTVPPSYYGLVP